MDAMTILLASLSLTDAANDGVASSRVTDATGTVSVVIQRGFALTEETRTRPVEGASRRTGVVVDRDGERRPIHLVEFE